MKKSTLLLLFVLLCTQTLRAQTWTSLATDATGDGTNASLLDGTGLSYRYNATTDSLFFKITVAHAVWPPLGINILFSITDSTAGPATAWNTTQNASFLYNRVITAWFATDTTGIVGVADAIGFTMGNYTNLHSNDIKVTVDTTNGIYILAVKRTDIFTGTNFNANVIAAVGSDQLWNDDIPNTGSGHISIMPTGISGTTAASGLVKIYPNPTKGLVNIEFKTSKEYYNVSLTNGIGQQIRHEKIKAQSSNILDLQGLVSGYYFVKIEDGENTATEKILIQ